jgi:hypothetical protein
MHSRHCMRFVIVMSMRHGADAAALLYCSGEDSLRMQRFAGGGSVVVYKMMTSLLFPYLHVLSLFIPDLLAMQQDSEALAISDFLESKNVPDNVSLCPYLLP